jgi:hypothetical protein
MLICGPNLEDRRMRSKRHKPEEKISKLRQVDVLTGQARSIADAVTPCLGAFYAQHRMVHDLISGRMY